MDIMDNVDARQRLLAGFVGMLIRTLAEKHDKQLWWGLNENTLHIEIQYPCNAVYSGEIEIRCMSLKFKNVYLRKAPALSISITIKDPSCINQTSRDVYVKLLGNIIMSLLDC